jgi:hypothetical protein
MFVNKKVHLVSSENSSPFPSQSSSPPNRKDSLHNCYYKCPGKGVKSNHLHLTLFYINYEGETES